MLNLSGTAQSALMGLVFFLLGAAVGAGGFYLYTSKVLLPRYQEQVTKEIFSGKTPAWGNFFKKIEEEKSRENPVNPFEGVGETAPENYVNPFDLIE